MVLVSDLQLVYLHASAVCGRPDYAATASFSPAIEYGGTFRGRSFPERQQMDVDDSLCR